MEPQVKTSRDMKLGKLVSYIYVVGVDVIAGLPIFVCLRREMHSAVVI